MKTRHKFGRTGSGLLVEGLGILSGRDRAVALRKAAELGLSVRLGVMPSAEAQQQIVAAVLTDRSCRVRVGQVLAGAH